MLLRPLVPDDFDRVDHILQAAYNLPHTFVPRLERQLAIQPDGWYVIGPDAALLGVGGVTFEDTLGYIGLIGVDPVAQRQGIATALMRALIDLAVARGCQTIALDASPVGKPLYERLGFVTADTVDVWRRPAPSALLPEPEETATSTILPFADPDLAALLACDARCFGYARRHCVLPYLEEARTTDPGRVLIARSANGQVSGYLLLQPNGLLGPWGAEDGIVAQHLLGTVLSQFPEQTLSVQMPTANVAGTDLLRRAGFTDGERLTHMVLGAMPPTARRQRVFGQINFALG